MTSVDTTLSAARLMLIYRGFSSDAVRLVRDHGIDHRSIATAVGALGVVPVTFSGRFFDFDDDEGELAVVVEVFGDDGETVIDLAAWRPSAPTVIATFSGRASILGEAVAWNPASYFGGRPLRVYRDATKWLVDSCHGVVIADMARSARALQDVLATMGAIAAEDEAHAAQISDAIAGLADLSRILVPQAARIAA